MVHHLDPPQHLALAAQVAAIAGGALLIAATAHGLVVTLVVPRRPRRRIAPSWLAWAVWNISSSAFTLLARGRARRARRADPRLRYEVEDRVLGLLGPMSLLALLGMWLALTFLGFALVLYGASLPNFGTAARLAGSSMLTLGVQAPSGHAQTAIGYLAAAAGLAALALEIGYLPTIYGHYSRREALMRVLEARAGQPAWGPEILVRQHNVGSLPAMGQFYADWEAWTAELLESHLTYPWLLLFRSPEPLQSWLTSLLAVIDSAAMYLAVCPSTPAAPQARHAVRMGFTALRRIADAVGVDYDPDPKPTDPLRLTEAEFASAVEYLASVEFPLEREAAQSWVDFRGWRVNYESIVYDLARRLHAPPARWSGAAHPIAPDQPLDRTPDDLEGARLPRPEQFAAP